MTMLQYETLLYYDVLISLDLQTFSNKAMCLFFPQTNGYN